MRGLGANLTETEIELVIKEVLQITTLLNNMLPCIT